MELAHGSRLPSVELEYHNARVQARYSLRDSTWRIWVNINGSIWPAGAAHAIDV